MSVDLAALKVRARDWLAADPDPDTRAELEQVLATNDSAGLAARFAGPLEFGTAGLRGPMGAGESRMNRVTVMRASAGLAAYLREHGGTSVVIGYDARHHSDTFARDAAAVFSGSGLRVFMLPEPLPTPVLAFAVRYFQADAGVMITASHNPAADNGYKVYLGDGAQIVPPVDGEIAAAIAAVGPVGDIARGEDFITAGVDLIEGYLSGLAALTMPEERDIYIAYTPMHGVGAPTVVTAMQRAGFPPPALPQTQATPDPDFPTVAFPNPEEPGAMDAVITLGSSLSTDLALANDPDADRLAVAVASHDPDASTQTISASPAPGGGGTIWRTLSGNEVGAILGEYMITATSGPDRLVASSLVSSRLLSKIAADHGVRHAETLTGFKWIVRSGPGRLVFGFEEALGLSVAPEWVRDKDGISALLVLCAVAAREKAAGRSLVDVLDRLARTYGVHATDQVSVRAEGTDGMAGLARVTERLRSHPPTEVGGLRVMEVEDLLTHPRDGWPASDVLVWLLEDDSRVIVRPSGTEPRLKAYLEVIELVSGRSRDGVTEARTEATRRLDSLAEAVRRLVRL